MLIGNRTMVFVSGMEQACWKIWARQHVILNF
jgi:hypothetical protein